MATQAPCAVCQRVFDVPAGSVENTSSSFFLTANDQLELKTIMERSFQRNLRVFLFVKRSIKNYTLNSADELQQILEHGSQEDLGRNEDENPRVAPLGTVQHQRVEKPHVDIVRNEDETQRSLFFGLLSRYNWTTTDRTDDPKFAAPYMDEKTIIRTMPDRNANINDLVWVIKRAHNNKTGLSAFFLHKKHFVWVSIPQPPTRAPHVQQVADRDIEVLTTELKNLFFFRSNFSRINELMLGTGAITYFKYNARQFEPLVLTATGPTCTVCEKAFPIPMSATQNKVGDDANEYYLTAGDLAALTTIKNNSFRNGVMRLGFITRIASNLSSNREIAGRIDQGNVREVTEPVKGLARVVTDRVKNVATMPVRAVGTMYNEPITALKGVVVEPIKAFGRVISYFKSSDIDDLLTHHNGENVLFRTMLDQTASINHVVWLVERAREQQAEVNAFFLHKRHFLWVKVVRPPHHNSSQDRKRSANLMRFLLKDLRKNFALRKKTIPAINEKLVGIARVAYHRYPDRTWVDSVTDAVADNKVMSLSVGGILLLVGGYYSSGQSAQDVGSQNASDEPPAREEPPKENVPPNGNENIDGADCVWNTQLGGHRLPNGAICQPPRANIGPGPVPMSVPTQTPGFIAPTPTAFLNY